jgi:hypothetical protein
MCCLEIFYQHLIGRNEVTREQVNFGYSTVETRTETPRIKIRYVCVQLISAGLCNCVWWALQFKLDCTCTVWRSYAVEVGLLFVQIRSKLSSLWSLSGLFGDVRSSISDSQFKVVHAFLPILQDLCSGNSVINYFLNCFVIVKISLLPFNSLMKRLYQYQRVLLVLGKIFSVFLFLQAAVK